MWVVGESLRGRACEAGYTGSFCVLASGLFGMLVHGLNVPVTRAKNFEHQVGGRTDVD